MTWFAQSANATEAAKEHVAFFLAVDFDFPSSGHARFWTGIGDITFLGNTYTGVGELGRVDAMPEHVRLVAEPKSFQLHHELVQPSWLPESDIDNCFGRSVAEYFGFLSPTTGQLVATPEINWEGRIDKIRRSDGAAPFIQVIAEHRLSMIDRPDGWRYTHEHQQQFYPGDFGLKEVPTIDTTEVLWGGFRVYPGVTVPGNGGKGGRTYRR